jgi:hypothetical protein
LYIVSLDVFIDAMLRMPIALTAAPSAQTAMKAEISLVASFMGGSLSLQLLWPAIGGWFQQVSPASRRPARELLAKAGQGTTRNGVPCEVPQGCSVIGAARALPSRTGVVGPGVASP